MTPRCNARVVARQRTTIGPGRRADGPFPSPYFGPGVSSEAGCVPPAQSITEGRAVNLPPFDHAGEAEVDAYAQVAVTFAIGKAGQS